ncbi:Phosphoadenosine phosphosulfate reductase [termite gut metagenome]|uniref:Phosphoadenosine phosphosulfate reductase n=1 Tax=termite gut metagenome TaxID=433724 RepID=A0A5J4SFJ3_9ZZZZ
MHDTIYLKGIDSIMYSEVLQELNKKIEWSLEQKIDHTIGTIETFIYKTNKTPYISFSGGKDSTVLLDIARRFINPDMKAVFCNTGNEYPEIVNFVKQTDNVTIIHPTKKIKDIIETYGFPLISKETSYKVFQARTTKSERLLDIRLTGGGGKIGKIPEKWKFLIDAPFQISDRCCYYLKKKPFQKYEKETEELPIIGVMTSESRMRKMSYAKRGECNSFETKIVTSYPLSIWTDKDIWDYIHKFNVPYCCLYDNEEVKRTGCMFCGFGAQFKNECRFDVLKKEHERIFNIIMNYENNGITYKEALEYIGIEI